MDTQTALNLAGKHLQALKGHIFNVLTVTKPVSPAAAANLAKVISKLSPLLGNLIEFNTVEILNDKPDFNAHGTWQRQDPGFPDTIFRGSIKPVPGFEIKAWFPLATEITARFKESQSHFTKNNTHVAMLAWLPEKLIYGKPEIIAVCVLSGKSVAAARDTHYHNPPDYIVLEPEDTTARTSNLQQTNTNGYKFQGTAKEFQRAKKLVASWGRCGDKYKPTPEYQAKIRQLFSKFSYRLDTNFAKMDRIVHPEIEKFKNEVMGTEVHGLTVQEWRGLLAGKDDETIRAALESRFGITAQDSKALVQ
ncbi:MAG: hypothetical protein M9920_04150 [Verrucomicrobiae bacterium]|nr:hypothetical protein [Verrucomicrobiae bacterium]